MIILPLRGSRSVGTGHAIRIVKFKSLLETLSLGTLCSTIIACSSTSAELPNVGNPEARQRHQVTFFFTGKEQFFSVPTGVTEIIVIASGASGETNKSEYGAGSPGGLVRATISVKPQEKLAIFVGGQGGTPYTGSGGYNGGGSASCYSGVCAGAGGGGASDVRQGGGRLKNRVIVAGGGGGWGGFGAAGGGGGGLGGGLTGGAGGNGPWPPGGYGGGGGTQTSGGQGGTGSYSVGTCNPGNGGNGKRGIGGAGGLGCEWGGGGGGGGYFGGGGGGGSGLAYYDDSAYYGAGGGGGGGSSYVEKSAKRVKSEQGKAALGNGRVHISW